MLLKRLSDPIHIFFNHYRIIHNVLKYLVLYILLPVFQTGDVHLHFQPSISVCFNDNKN